MTAGGRPASAAVGSGAVRSRDLTRLAGPARTGHGEQAGGEGCRRPWRVRRAAPGVLARRGDPLCPTCVKAAREMASRPLWVFDSLLLREALAQVNLAAVPAIVRAACGLSQRDLAAIVGWSPAALSYYERGVRDGMFDIRTVLQFADAVGMPRAALLPLVSADPDADWRRHRGRDGHGTGPARFRRPGRRGRGGCRSCRP